MSDLEVVARIPAGGGHPVQRLVCHPRLPLVAAFDAERPAVHIWDLSAGRLRELGSVHAESAAYGDAPGWEWYQRIPAVAWHPEEPVLVVSGEDGVVRWSPAGSAEPDGVPPAARYRGLAFSPDGGTLWASPSSSGEGDAWESSDVLDLAAASVGSGPRWDTGVAEHPGGGLVVTLSSDQGATHAFFARVDRAGGTAVMRFLCRALILDCDGYETPLFSADGRHFAIRGNAYDNSVEVFEFPSLRRVLGTTLGAPHPGYPASEEWLDQMRAWSRHNLAFGAQPGVLWIGDPTGRLVEVDLATERVTEHEVLNGSAVSALAATATGGLVVAGAGGDLVLLSVDPGRSGAGRPDRDASGALVSAFLDSTSDIPDDGDPEDHLVLTDGVRGWASDDLATVTSATAADPTWLRIQAAMNQVRER